MSSVPEHRTVSVNGIDLHIVLQGEGPLVVMCHGMPGLWYSWRHQLPMIAAAGFRAVAIDQRGYGRSSRPTAVEAYDSDHTVADLLGLLDALGEERAIFIGQDFGAAQVYNLAARHPHRVLALIGMSCPYDFDFSGRGGAGSSPPPEASYKRAFARPDMRPSECFAAIAEQQFFYAHYYQAVGPADSELGENPRLFLQRLFWALSARGKLLDWDQYPKTVTGYLEVLADPDMDLPWPWMSQQDMDYYVAEFERTGPETAFIGGLSAYRVADRNWEINRQYADARIIQPSLFISGAEDPVISMIGDEALAVLEERSDDLRGIELIAGAGHFVQQEQPEATNRAILSFLGEL
jgi:pimeloyl-ACP methyl ester carboxylesterase